MFAEQAERARNWAGTARCTETAKCPRLSVITLATTDQNRTPPFGSYTFTAGRRGRGRPPRFATNNTTVQGRPELPGFVWWHGTWPNVLKRIAYRSGPRNPVNTQNSKKRHCAAFS